MNLKPRDDDKGWRPDVPPGMCSYCKGTVDSHRPNCVVPQKSVVLELRTLYVVSVPRGFQKEEIEFMRNDGSSCMDNDMRQSIVHRLELSEKTDGTESVHCFCSGSEVTYMREATREDHEALAFNGPDVEDHSELLETEPLGTGLVGEVLAESGKS